VDGENEAACALYESLGFSVRARTLWYEKLMG
jgi:ribosomal protein S18 acetylase RimI-like enzyme